MRDKQSRAARRSARRLFFPLFHALLLPAAVSAQADSGARLLPQVRYFEGPFADPIEPRFSIGLIVTDVLSRRGRERDAFVLPDAEDARTDWQASAALGGTIPLWRPLNRPEGGIVVAGQAGVFGRFRIELPSRDDLGQDWIVAMPIEMAWNNWSGRFRISHRSSHLGDEFVQASGATRIEFGGEAVDALAAYSVSRIGRFYAGGAWIFRSYTDHLPVLREDGVRDRFVLQLGGDGRWDIGPRHVNLIAGIDWQSAERTRWKGALGVAGGLEVRYGRRALGLVLRYFEGVSSMGEFFLTPEEFWSLELTADF